MQHLQDIAFPSSASQRPAKIATGKLNQTPAWCQHSQNIKYIKGNSVKVRKQTRSTYEISAFMPAGIFDDRPTELILEDTGDENQPPATTWVATQLRTPALGARRPATPSAFGQPVCTCYACTTDSAIVSQSMQSSLKTIGTAIHSWLS